MTRQLAKMAKRTEACIDECLYKRVKRYPQLGLISAKTFVLIIEEKNVQTLDMDESF